ncbi:ROK family transcriptional regulator [Actinopolyspora mortivallis]|uniref:ROK family transcriptional regulator n=1 Tax=Actinopolyspora mortivallis TaxID=33906 RepID=UPI00036303F1|nr:ROK family transcriptional regulator [Actinopolyspora mortivallis]
MHSGDGPGTGTDDGRLDQHTVRRNNLVRVLEEVRASRARSRSELATRTGLSKATVSGLVTELIERRLLRESGRHHAGGVGRPGRLLELDGSTVAALGVEVNAHCLAVRGVDLAGRVLSERRMGCDTPRAGAEQAVGELARLAGKVLGEVERSGARLAGIGVAVPGIVDVPNGIVRHAPNLLWRDVPIASWLRRWLALDERHTVVVDNEANLAALAEFNQPDNTADDLVSLTGEVGVGAGVVTGRRLLRGSAGSTGEIGHVPVVADGRACGCGQHGCLETRIGLEAAVRAAAPDLIGTARDPARQARILLRRAEEGDPRALSGLDEVGHWLGVGISIVVNLFNPSLVVLGGYFAAVAAHVLPRATRELRARVVAGQAAACPVTASAFGFTAAVRGGANIIVEEVLDDPCRCPPTGPRGKG